MPNRQVVRDITRNTFSDVPSGRIRCSIRREWAEVGLPAVATGPGCQPRKFAKWPIRGCREQVILAALSLVWMARAGRAIAVWRDRSAVGGYACEFRQVANYGDREHR